MRVQPWIKAFLVAVLIVFCYVQIRFPGRLDDATGLAALANYILYSQFLAIGTVLLSVLYRHEHDRRLKPLYLAGMALFFFGLISGEGRSGLLALLVLLPFILGNLFPGTSRSKLLLGCLIAVLVVLMSPKVQTRIHAGINDLKLMQQDDTETSLGYRADMWKTAYEVWREHPLLGAGPDGFRIAWHGRPLSQEAQAFVEPHNAFLFYASSYGVAGLAALLWLYAALLWTGWRTRQTLEGGIVFSFAVILVFGSLTNTMFMGATSHAWLMLFIGLQGGLLQRKAAA
jgi:O-antigen ligase